eukprot:GCRY01008779.1.p2 GENE.GCRY01008779.1~~GCRY01008779.1.p2  ORF type:complete len:100 (-),score=6.90 GCRY01008779.1:153-452(-)
MAESLLLDVVEHKHRVWDGRDGERKGKRLEQHYHHKLMAEIPGTGREWVVGGVGDKSGGRQLGGGKETADFGGDGSEGVGGRWEWGVLCVCQRLGKGEE